MILYVSDERVMFYLISRQADAMVGPDTFARTESSARAMKFYFIKALQSLFDRRVRLLHASGSQRRLQRKFLIRLQINFRGEVPIAD